MILLHLIHQISLLQIMFRIHSVIKVIKIIIFFKRIIINKTIKSDMFLSQSLTLLLEYSFFFFNFEQVDYQKHF